MIPFNTRPYVPERDQPLVYSSWLNQVRNAPPISELSHEEFAQHRAIVDHLLAKHGATMAVSPNDPDRAYGWICAADPYLHFVYVRNTYRRFGIAKELLAAAFPGFPDRPILYTHNTRAMKFRAPSWNARFYPYGVQR